MSGIYDGAFRTILNDCRKLVIPEINEIFGENYTGNEKIEFFPNEHFIDRQDEADKKRITDTNFRITGTETKRYHLECESSYLRTRKKTPDKMKYVIVTLGGTVQYDIPIMKVKSYSLDDIFEKHLLMLIPFYIFSHEDSFQEYNDNSQKLTDLESKYKGILRSLDNLEEQGFIGAFDKRTIIELSSDVMKEITQKFKNVQKGMGDIMGGALIETEARRLRDEAREEAQKEIARKTALRMLKRGKLTIDEIAEDSGLSVAEVEQLKVQLPELLSV